MGVPGFLSHFFFDQLARTPPKPTRSFSGETVIITGSNTGLGKDAARQIVALGAAKVIMGVRTVSKGESAKEDIENSTGQTGVLEVWQVDVASYASVKQFASRCKALPRIDAVVQNAGIWPTTYRQAEGNEEAITVNVISTILLTLILAPKLRESAQHFGTHPRIVLLSSGLFEVAPLKQKKASSILDAMNDKSKADMENRYVDTKLILVMYLLALVREQEQQASDHNRDVTINVINPGFAKSELVREMKMGMGEKIFERLVARTTEEGARCLVYAAGAGPESHGKFMNNGAIWELDGLWVNSKAGREISSKIYAEINAKLEQIEPGVTRNI